MEDQALNRTELEGERRLVPRLGETGDGPVFIGQAFGTRRDGPRGGRRREAHPQSPEPPSVVTASGSFLATDVALRRDAPGLRRTDDRHDVHKAARVVLVIGQLVAVPGVE